MKKLKEIGLIVGFWLTVSVLGIVAYYTFWHMFGRLIMRLYP